MPRLPVRRQHRFAHRLADRRLREHRVQQLRLGAPSVRAIVWPSSAWPWHLRCRPARISKHIHAATRLIEDPPHERPSRVDDRICPHRRQRQRPCLGVGTAQRQWQGARSAPPPAARLGLAGARPARSGRQGAEARQRHRQSRDQARERASAGCRPRGAGTGACPGARSARPHPRQPGASGRGAARPPRRAAAGAGGRSGRQGRGDGTGAGGLRRGPGAHWSGHGRPRARGLA